MRCNQIACKLVGSALAIACAVSLAMALSGCGATVSEWHDPGVSRSVCSDFLTSGLRGAASFPGLASPLPRTEPRAIAEHEVPNLTSQSRLSDQQQLLPPQA